MIRGAVFDMDGTITDSNPFWDRAPAAFLEKLGKKAAPELPRIIFSMTLQEASEYMINEYSLSLKPEEVTDGIYETMGRFYSEEVELKPGIREILGLIRKMGIPMAVATVTGHDLVEKALGRHGISELFECVVTTDDAGAGKHDPAVYIMASDKIGSRAEETLVVEDALHALKTAGSAGFITVGVYDEASRDLQREIRAASDLYLPDYRELSGLMKILR